MKNLSIEERFWSKVDRHGDCWEWTAGRHRQGYGQFWVQEKGRNEGAHRFAWELANGPLPAGMCVLHRCDNPPCCNPAHLFLGTLPDNNKDMTDKGRRRIRGPKPIRHGTVGGRQAHKRRGETPCEPCRLAYNANAFNRKHHPNKKEQ